MAPTATAYVGPPQLTLPRAFTGWPWTFRTLGSEGARVERRSQPAVVVGPVKDAKFVEPTGAGDAFRCGFLAATAWGLSTELAGYSYF